MRDQQGLDSTGAGQERKLEYLNRLFGSETELLSQVRAHAQAADREGMQVSPFEGQLLQCLVKWIGAKSVLELGTLFGYSTLWMAGALPSDGRIITVEKDPQRHKEASGFFETSPYKQKIQALCGDASELRPQLEQSAPYDLIFIDANKSAYLDSLIWGEGVLRKGGFVIADNTFFFGGVYGDEVSKRWSQKAIQGMKDFNERLADPNRYRSTLVPTPEGLTVAEKMF